MDGITMRKAITNFGAFINCEFVIVIGVFICSAYDVFTLLHVNVRGIYFCSFLNKK